MKPPNLYLETSVFGFYYDEKSENILKRKATKGMFEQIRSGLFCGFTSPLTVKELTNTPSPYKERLLQLIEKYGIETMEVEKSELEELFQNYMAEKIVPIEFENDARHVAYATILKVDILVSFNLEHVVNIWKTRQFNAVNLKLGYSLIAVGTPEEVIYYGDYGLQR